MPEPATATACEIEGLLGVHHGEPMDYVAIVTLLNTVAGGHYDERHTEAQIRSALLQLLERGRIAVTPAPGAPTPSAALAAEGQSGCCFYLSR